MFTKSKSVVLWPHSLRRDIEFNTHSKSRMSMKPLNRFYHTYMYNHVHVGSGPAKLHIPGPSSTCTLL